MKVVDVYNDFRGLFPEITGKADVEHQRLYGTTTQIQPYLWFESVAKAINREMMNKTDPATFRHLFEFFRHRFAIGDSEIRDCIDVSFTENLFWRVPQSEAQPYWAILPNALKDLYVRFHNQEPA